MHSFPYNLCNGFGAPFSNIVAPLVRQHCLFDYLNMLTSAFFKSLPKSSSLISPTLAVSRTHLETDLIKPPHFKPSQQLVQNKTRGPFDHHMFPPPLILGD
ncbi:hypothetical protein AAC387_Pa03g4021 [Persea americana]